MWLFAVFFLPMLLSFYLLKHREARCWRAVILGLFCGAVFSVLAILFGSGYRMHSAGFLANFLHLFLFETFVPLAVLSAIVFVLFRDEMEHKVAVLLPFFLGFFILYIPFRIFFRSETLSVFVLFAKPMLLASCITGAAYAIGLLAVKDGGKGNVVFVCACGIIAVAAPAAAEVCWFMGLPVVLWMIVGLAGLCSPLLLAAYKRRSVGRASGMS